MRLPLRHRRSVFDGLKMNLEVAGQQHLGHGGGAARHHVQRGERPARCVHSASASTLFSGRRVESTHAELLTPATRPGHHGRFLRRRVTERRTLHLLRFHADDPDLVLEVEPTGGLRSCRRDAAAPGRRSDACALLQVGTGPRRTFSFVRLGSTTGGRWPTPAPTRRSSPSMPSARSLRCGYKHVGASIPCTSAARLRWASSRARRLPVADSHAVDGCGRLGRAVGVDLGCSPGPAVCRWGTGRPRASCRVCGAVCPGP